jgi:hypothetical protein
VKAEMLTRETIRIYTRIYNNDHINMGLSCTLLARILLSQGKLGNETMELFERSLVNDTKCFGPFFINLTSSNFNFGIFYHKLADTQQNAQKRKEYLSLSKSKFEEAVRIWTKIFGPDKPQTIEASYLLFIISLELSEA